MQALCRYYDGIMQVRASLVNQLVKNPPSIQETCLGLIPGSGRSSREGIGYPLQYSGLENSMGYIVHRVSKSQTRLSEFHFHFHYAGKDRN